MNRKIYYWKFRDSEIQLGERTVVMGVLNVTPDSFSDGGRFNDPDRAYARALELEEQGADIIDLGAESTRPGSHRITADEEWQRLVPVLKKLRDALRVPLSLDTYKSEIAARALDYGVVIFNDPSGLTFDPGLAKVAANGNAGLILNHMRGQPETWARLPPLPDPVNAVGHELEAAINRARLAGVDRARIVVDPGLGFGKRKEQNSEILAKLRKLADLDYPILIGASRKSFLSKETEAETAFATAAAVAIGVFNGAHIVRVHDVKQMKSVLLVADEIARTVNPGEPEENEETAPAVRPAKTSTAKSGSGKQAKPDPWSNEERPRPARAPLARPAAVELSVPPTVTAEPEPAPAASAAEGETPAPPEPGIQTPFAPPAPVSEEPVPREREIPAGKPPAKEPGKERTFEPRRTAGWNPPPKREFRPGGPPRREYPPRDSRSGDRPARGDSRSDGPPRREYPPRDSRSGDRPARGDSRSAGPPRRDFPPRRDSGPRQGPPRSDRPPARGRDFRPGGPRSGPGERPSGRPADRFNDRPSGRPPERREGGFRPEGPPPKRTFRSDGPPRGSRPGGPKSDGPRRDDSGGPNRQGPPPRRPLRKRP